MPHLVDRPLAVNRYYVEVQLALTTRKEDGMEVGGNAGHRRCIMDVDMFMRNWATVPVERAVYYRYTDCPPLLREVKRWIPEEYVLISMRYGPTVDQTSSAKASRCLAKADEYKVFKVS